MAVTAAASTAQSTQTAKAQATLSSNYETFLKLLTTQLQNQDPLSPLDSTKFTEQLVSYSQVEQQIQTNTNLASLISTTKSAAGANAVNYLGKTAVTSGPVSSLSDGSASWRYSLPRDASAIQVNVTDGKGNIIRTLTGNASTGTHQITWDGKSSTGATMPGGQYSLAITARGADGAAIPAKISGLGLVKEIDMSGVEPLVQVGSRQLKLTDIVGLQN